MIVPPLIVRPAAPSARSLPISSVPLLSVVPTVFTLLRARCNVPPAISNPKNSESSRTVNVPAVTIIRSAESTASTIDVPSTMIVGVPGRSSMIARSTDVGTVFEAQLSASSQFNVPAPPSHRSTEATAVRTTSFPSPPPYTIEKSTPSTLMTEPPGSPMKPPEILSVPSLSIMTNCWPASMAMMSVMSTTSVPASITVPATFNWSY